MGKGGTNESSGRRVPGPPQAGFPAVTRPPPLGRHAPAGPQRQRAAARKVERCMQAEQPAGSTLPTWPLLCAGHLDQAAQWLAVGGHKKLLVRVHNVIALGPPKVVLQKSGRGRWQRC